jgi:hypothetical protein
MYMSSRLLPWIVNLFFIIVGFYLIMFIFRRLEGFNGQCWNNRKKSCTTRADCGGAQCMR